MTEEKFTLLETKIDTVEKKLDKLHNRVDSIGTSIAYIAENLSGKSTLPFIIIGSILLLVVLLV